MADQGTRAIARELSGVGEKLFRLSDWLGTALWFVPIIGVLAASALATGTNYVDRALFDATAEPFLLRDPETARNILTVIAASMLTFTALVFTITIVVVQQAGSQYSPRVIRHFLRDRLSKITMAVFLGTFAFSLMTLGWMAASPRDEPFVPTISILAAFVTVLVSLALFVAYLDHVAQSLRVGNIVDGLAEESRRLLQRLCPIAGSDEASGSADFSTDGPAGHAVEGDESDGGTPSRAVEWTKRPGTLNTVDADSLVRLARREDCVLRLRPGIGDFVPEGSVVLEVSGEAPDLELAELLATLGIAAERTMLDDLAYGFRQLVDIAERALSPGINDPTTAVQVLDRLHDLLGQLAARDLPSPEHRDEDGTLRLILPRREWGDYLSLALDEIRLYGAGSLQVARRLRALLEDLMAVVPAARRPAVEDQLRRLDEAVQNQFERGRDRQEAREADAQGVGA